MVKEMTNFFNEKLLFNNESVIITELENVYHFNIRDCEHNYCYTESLNKTLINEKTYKQMVVSIYSQYVCGKLNNLIKILKL